MDYCISLPRVLFYTLEHYCTCPTPYSPFPVLLQAQSPVIFHEQIQADPTICSTASYQIIKRIKRTFDRPDPLSKQHSRARATTGRCHLPCGRKVRSRARFLHCPKQQRREQLPRKPLRREKHAAEYDCIGDFSVGRRDSTVDEKSDENNNENKTRGAENDPRSRQHNLRGSNMRSTGHRFNATRSCKVIRALLRTGNSNSL